jgi:hypothetical protein
MRSAILPALAPDAEGRDQTARPGLWRRVVAFGRAALEVVAESRELRRELARRYPFVDI